MTDFHFQLCLFSFSDLLSLLFVYIYHSMFQEIISQISLWLTGEIIKK